MTVDVARCPYCGRPLDEHETPGTIGGMEIRICEKAPQNGIGTPIASKPIEQGVIAP
jgi:hypothetical protein